MGETYPGVVELGLDAYVFAFLLVLGAQDLEFGGFERTGGCVSTSRIPGGLARSLSENWTNACSAGKPYLSASAASAVPWSVLSGAEMDSASTARAVQSSRNTYMEAKSTWSRRAQHYWSIPESQSANSKAEFAQVPR